MTIEDSAFALTLYDPSSSWSSDQTNLLKENHFTLAHVQTQADITDDGTLILAKYGDIPSSLSLPHHATTQQSRWVALVDAGDLPIAVQSIHKSNLYSYFTEDEGVAQLAHIARGFYQDSSSYLATIRQVLHDTSGKPDTPVTLQRVTELLWEQYEYLFATIRLVDELGNLTFYEDAAFGLKQSANAQRSIAIGNSGVLQQVFSMRATKPIIEVQAYHSSDSLLQFARAEGVRGLVVVPLTLREDVLGVLIVGSAYPHAPSPDKLNLLECLAEIAALDHNNYRNYRMLRQLENINDRLANAESLKEAIAEIPDQALTVGDANGMAFGFYLAAETRYVQEWSISKNVDGQLINWKDKKSAWFDLAEYVRDQRRSSDGELLVPDIDNPPPEIQSLIIPLRPLFDESHIKAMVGMRIQLGQRTSATSNSEDTNHYRDPLGVLFVFYKTVHPFAIASKRHADKLPLNIYCDQLASTLRRTHRTLRVELERKMLQDFALSTNSSTPRRATDSGVWKQLLAQLMTHTGAQHGCIALQQQGKEWNYHCQAMTDEEAASWLNRTRNVTGSYELEPAFRNRLLTPIRTTETQEFVGAICLLSSDLDRFDDFDGQACANLAVHIGIESQMGALLGTRNERTGQMRALVSSSHQLSLIRPIRNLLLEEITQLRRHINCDIVYLHLYSPYWKQFSPEIVSQKYSSTPEAVHCNLQVLAGLVAEIADSEETRLDLSPAYESAIRQYNLQLYEGIVIRDDRNRPIAVLSLLNNGNSRDDVYPRPHHIENAINEIRNHIRHTYVFTNIVEQLQSMLEIDVVRLHVHRQYRDAWSVPDTAGSLRKPSAGSSWPRQAASLNGPIGKSLLNDDGFEFVDNIEGHPFLDGNFARRENIRSAGYVVLRGDDDLLGVLFVGQREHKPWSDGLQFTVRVFASQAAAAIQNRRRLQRLKNESIQSQTIQKIIKHIVQAQKINADGWQAILNEAISMTGAEFGFIAIRNGSLKHLKIKAVHSLDPTAAPYWQERYDPITIEPDNIVGRTYLERRRQIANASTEPGDLFLLDQESTDQHSAISAAILDEDRDAIGVIYLRHAKDELFDENSLRTLISLASVANLVPSLKPHGGEVDYPVLVDAWASLIAADWWSNVLSNIWSLRIHLELLHKAAQKNDQEGVSEHIDTMLETIEEVDKPNHLYWVPTEDKYPERTFQLDKALQELAVQYLHGHTHVVWDSDGLNNPHIRVNIPRPFFDLAMDKLINNAIKAMRDKKEGTLKITTADKGKSVWIDISDTGKGLDAQAKTRLFQTAFDKRKKRDGTGTGALLARHILKLFDGNALLVRSVVEQGTTIRVKLPIVN